MWKWNVSLWVFLVGVIILLTGLMINQLQPTSGTITLAMVEAADFGFRLVLAGAVVNTLGALGLVAFKPR